MRSISCLYATNYFQKNKKDDAGRQKKKIDLLYIDQHILKKAKTSRKMWPFHRLT